MEGAVKISSDDGELVLKKKGANTEQLTNSAHHSKPFFTGRRQSRRRRGVVSNRTGADWTEKAGLKESPRGGKHTHYKTLGLENSCT